LSYIHVSTTGGINVTLTLTEFPSDIKIDRITHAVTALRTVEIRVHNYDDTVVWLSPHNISRGSYLASSLNVAYDDFLSRSERLVNRSPLKIKLWKMTEQIASSTPLTLILTSDDQASTNKFQAVMSTNYDKR
jgi:hypothetical protein